MNTEELHRESLKAFEKELQDLETKLTKLREMQARRDQLYTVVAQTRFALGMDHYKPPPPETEPADELTKDGQFESTKSHLLRTFAGNPTIWEAARETLKRSKEPMGLPEILEVLRGFGFSLAGRNGKESLRAVLNKKSDVFTRAADGRYSLV